MDIGDGEWSSTWSSTWTWTRTASGGDIVEYDTVEDKCAMDKDITGGVKHGHRRRRVEFDMEFDMDMDENGKWRRHSGVRHSRRQMRHGQGHHRRSETWTSATASGVRHGVRHGHGRERQVEAT
ncbi:hypothetical protein OS493_002430 [Desmophyllum pertusum]|uniref:Uncharacterized protein n=1 Tax=Desmophyllum pertusum TaxID=174260 RepID=A0A9X0CPL8_9CNID|nr:hypothetical protein OS493_002430 [Desmophyllum pertusum]